MNARRRQEVSISLLIAPRHGIDVDAKLNVDKEMLFGCIIIRQLHHLSLSLSLSLSIHTPMYTT